MKTFGAISVAGLLLCVGFAAAPIGSISSSAPFQLRGSRVPVAGVPSWPVVVGDEIGTEASPATITLRDGSVVTLDKDTQAQIEQQGSHLAFRLKSGTMQFNVARHSTLQIINQNKAVPVQPGIIKTITTRPGPIKFLLSSPPPPPDPISAR